MSTRPALPVGFTISLDRSARVPGPDALVGGAPWRLLRLTPDGSRLLADLRAGAPVRDRRSGLLARRLVDAGLAHPHPSAGPLQDEIAVVVPARDRPDDLDRCLAALGTDLPVTVVDDASADPALVAQVAHRHGATVIRLTRNRGPAGARNAGLAATAAPVVAFVDSDCCATAAQLRRLAAHLADPVVAVAAPRVRGRSHGAGTWPAFAAHRSPLDLGRDPAAVRPGGRATYLPATTLVARRTALADVDGFDGTLRWGEDVDLAWRIHDAGWSLRYDPTVAVRHREPGRPADRLVRRFHYGASAGPLARRHGARLSGPALVGLVPPWVARRARRAGLPPALARRVAAHSARSTAAGLVSWALPLQWPLLAYAGRRTRSVVAVTATVAAGVDWSRRRPPVGPLPWSVASVVEDAAYGLGVWWGCWRSGTARPLLPRLASGGHGPTPGRRAGSAGDAGPGAHDDARMPGRT